jgi:hypothetical protein
MFSTRVRRTVTAAAFALLVPLLPGAATQGVAAAAPAPSGAQAGDGAAIVPCTSAVPPAGWNFRHTHPQPDACLKCEAEAGALEATGNFQAWCHDVVSMGVAALYTKCVACRGGEAPDAAPARPRTSGGQP